MPKHVRTAEEQAYINKLNQQSAAAQAAAKAEREAAARYAGSQGNVTANAEALRNLTNAQNASAAAQQAHSNTVRDHHKNKG